MKERANENIKKFFINYIGPKITHVALYDYSFLDYNDSIRENEVHILGGGILVLNVSSIYHIGNT